MCVYECECVYVCVYVCVSVRCVCANVYFYVRDVRSCAHVGKDNIKCPRAAFTNVSVHMYVCMHVCEFM